MNTEPQSYSELSNSISHLSNQLEVLSKFVDTNDANIRELLTNMTNDVNDLQSMIHGSDNLRLVGLAERFEQIEKRVEVIEDDRRSERDKLRGVQIGLGITAGSGVLTLGTLISQLFVG